MTVSFNRYFYNSKAIKEAIKAFKGLAKFEVKRENRYFRIKLCNINPRVKERIKDEFCNYVLFMNKNAD